MSDHRASKPSPLPVFRAVTYADIAICLRRGWADFRRAPRLALFFGGVYTVGGIAIFWLLSAYRQPLMILPIAVGFPLVGPFLAAGTYEVSRRLNTGEPMDMPGILGFIIRQSRREFAWMAFVVLFVFWIWMYQARILIALFLDMQAFGSVGALAQAVFATPEGLMMTAIGTVTGGVLAAILFASTVIAMPLLVERNIDVATALIASWKTVLASPGPMALWGAVIGGVTVLSMIPFFMGLLVTFPVMGFATWHLFSMITGATRHSHRSL